MLIYNSFGFPDTFLEGGSWDPKKPPLDPPLLYKLCSSSKQEKFVHMLGLEQILFSRNSSSIGVNLVFKLCIDFCKGLYCLLHSSYSCKSKKQKYKL